MEYPPLNNCHRTDVTYAKLCGCNYNSHHRCRQRAQNGNLRDYLFNKWMCLCTMRWMIWLCSSYKRLKLCSGAESDQFVVGTVTSLQVQEHQGEVIRVTWVGVQGATSYRVSWRRVDGEALGHVGLGLVVCTCTWNISGNQSITVFTPNLSLMFLHTFKCRLTRHFRCSSTLISSDMKQWW